MSDERLQELERAWQASGSVDDEAALLAHRVSSGDLSAERLALAAWVEHAAATQALTEPAADAASDFVGRVGQLRKWEGALHRAALAAVWATRDEGWDAVTEGIYTTVARWVAEPTATHQEAVSALLSASLPDPERRFFLPDSPRWAIYLLHSACEPRTNTRAARANSAVTQCPHIHPEGEAAIWKAICAELAPWALGYEDPVAARLS